MLNLRIGQDKRSIRIKIGNKYAEGLKNEVLPYSPNSAVQTQPSPNSAGQTSRQTSRLRAMLYPIKEADTNRY